jgi:hypothetical protein
MQAAARGDTIATELHLFRSMSRFHRLAPTLVLSLLLVGMQLGSELHAIAHVGESLRHTSDYSLIAPVDETCAMCALFAGGANAAAGDNDAPTIAVSDETAPRLAPASIATRAPAYYSSRAPPPLR